MIISKAALESCIATKGESVGIGADGSASARNLHVAIAAGPVTKEVIESVPLESGVLGLSGLTLTMGSATKIVRNIGRDTTFGGLLEHCNLDSDSSGAVTVTTHDGKRKATLAMAARVGSVGRAVIDLVRGVFIRARDTGSVAVVNRKALITALQAIDKGCADGSGETPVWIAVGDNGEIAIRAVNYRTGQRIVAVMSAYEEKRLEFDAWEEGKVKRGCVRTKRRD